MAFFSYPPIALSSDRQFQIAEHINYSKRLEASRQPQGGCVTVNLNLVPQTPPAPNAFLPSVPIIGANLVTIKEIVRTGPNVVHNGKILLCRSILPTYHQISLNLLVDDPDGQFVLRVALYNYTVNVLPVGTILAIMHPWFKMTLDGYASVRCEDPKQVCLVKANDPILRNVIWKAEFPGESQVTKNAASKKKADKDNSTTKIDDNSLANQGNCYYVEKNYMKALEFYTKAIALEPKNPVLFSNRALTYLALQNPVHALADTEIGLFLDNSHLKLLYRKAKALLMLKRYKEVVEFLDETQKRLKKVLTGNKEFKKLTEIGKIMFREFSRGVYDLEKMEEEAKQCKILENHADYSAPIFEIKEIQGKGRGLVATREIPGDTLVIACKAFAFVVGRQDTLSLAKNYATKTIQTVGLTEMVQQISDKLTANPELGGDFYQLYASRALGVLHDYDPSNPVDADRIRAIVLMNSFTTDSGLPGEYGNLGLWLLPSYLNHSCGESNCLWTDIGDFMFVRTKKDKKIKRGEELLISYTAAFRSFHERSLVFEKHWGFTCVCSRCVAERQLLG